jgi:hypothetical protein
MKPSGAGAYQTLHLISAGYRRLSILAASIGMSRHRGGKNKAKRQDIKKMARPVRSIAPAAVNPAKKISRVGRSGKFLDEQVGRLARFHVRPLSMT